MLICPLKSCIYCSLCCRQYRQIKSLTHSTCLNKDKNSLHLLSVTFSLGLKKEQRRFSSFTIPSFQLFWSSV